MFLRHITIMDLIPSLIGPLMLRSWSSKPNRDGKSDGMARSLALPRKLVHGPYNEKHAEMSSS